MWESWCVWWYYSHPLTCQGSSLGLPKPPSTSNQEATRASWRRSGLVPSRPTSGHRLLPPILDRRLVSGPLIRSVLGDLAQNYVSCMPWWVHESLCSRLIGQEEIVSDWSRVLRMGCVSFSCEVTKWALLVLGLVCAWSDNYALDNTC